MERNNLSISELRAKPIIQLNQDTITWDIAKVSIEGGIKGNVTQNEIQVRFFFPTMCMMAAPILNEFSFDTRQNLRYLVCLKRYKDNIYMFMHHKNTLMELPAVPVNLTGIKGTEERLKIVLLNVLEKGNRKIVEGALLDTKREYKRY